MNDYTALYRRFRPDSFERVIGQDHIVKTLVHQIESGKISHAYLFCGTRGTGKTTCAKIFARAINCEHPVNGSPCNRCETCRRLAEGNSLDINEIDAASNNGVDEIREIKENVRYAPTVGKYKVYIVDEVHMLSTAAFNALLKTLEEPPAHAVFLLATTEVHKLPATILSRCMRFDFRLVPDDRIIGLLSGIFSEIGVTAEEDALRLIARSAEGSVRDALTIADTCVSYCGARISYDLAAEIIGATDRGVVAEFAEHLLDGNVGKVFEQSAGFFSRGKSVVAFHREVLSALRDFCVLLTTKNAADLLVYPEPLFRKMEQAAKKYSVEHILECIDILGSAENEIKFSLHPRILFEAAALRCCKLTGVSCEALIARIARLEEQVAALQAGRGKIGSPVPAAGQPAAAPNRIRKEGPAQAADRSDRETEAPAGPQEEIPLPSAPPPEAGDGGSFGPVSASVQTAAEDQTGGPVVNAVEVRGTGSEPARPAGGLSEPSASEPGVSANRIWGTVTRALREQRNGLLYTICREATARTEGDTLVVRTEEQGVQALSRPNNRKTIESIVVPFGIRTVRFVTAEEQRESADEELERFRSSVGDKWVEK